MTNNWVTCRDYETYQENMAYLNPMSQSVCNKCSLGFNEWYCLARSCNLNDSRSFLLVSKKNIYLRGKKTLNSTEKKKSFRNWNCSFHLLHLKVLFILLGGAKKNKRAVRKCLLRFPFWQSFWKKIKKILPNYPKETTFPLLKNKHKLFTCQLMNRGFWEVNNSTIKKEEDIF